MVSENFEFTESVTDTEDPKPDEVPFSEFNIYVDTPEAKALRFQRALDWRKDYYFDLKAAKRASFFFENELQHVKGDCAGQRFVLQPWQRRAVRRAFGWKRRKDGLRKHRRVWIEVPKGNGKTPLGAGFGLYLFAADKEPGAEVICAAADKEQGTIAYEFARENCVRNPKLKKLVGRAYRRSMAILSTLSTFKVVSSEARTKHGTKIHGLILDEVHAIDDREYVETLISGTAKRPRSLTVMLTTAGYDPLSICHDFHEHAVKVRDGVLDDPELLPIIFAASEKEDWTDENTWKRANPNYDVTIMGNDLAAQCRMAKQMPSYENSFKRLFLNIWTTQDIRWLPMSLWDANQNKIDWTKYKRKVCYGGLDLASNSDVAALALAFPEEDGGITVFTRYWVPLETALQRQMKQNVPYQDWIKAGHMIGTEGNAIDFDFIRKEINELGNRFAIKELAIDRNFNAFQLSTQLSGDGFVVVPYGQGYFSMTAPSRYLEMLLLKQKLNHNLDPVLRWMASNVAVEQDAAGNIKPSKKKSKEKIDGIVALVMAIGRTIVHNNEKSVYETRGVLLI